MGGKIKSYTEVWIKGCVMLEVFVIAETPKVDMIIAMNDYRYPRKTPKG